MATTVQRSGILKKTKDNAPFITTTILGVVFGFLIGLSFPFLSSYKIYLPSINRLSVDVAVPTDQETVVVEPPESNEGDVPTMPMGSSLISSKYIPTNPRVAKLPPRIVVPESDLYLHRLWGLPALDLKRKAKYLATFSVGVDQMNNINACVQKFSENFQILLFHYDGRTNEWDRFEWSKNAIHVCAKKQTKWWYAKRFLHPDVVSAYEYIFIWDEDLGVEHFNAERYIELVKQYGLEISQPGVEPNNGLKWEMTRRRKDQDVHKVTMEKPGWCSDQHLPPCAAFVEIMAPVFSQKAWRCVWHMIQNDLVHGCGLDFALGRCVEPAHEKIGVVDSQWITHLDIPSLEKQAVTKHGKTRKRGVKKRCKNEWSMFQNRLAIADEAYHAQIGKG